MNGCEPPPNPKSLPVISAKTFLARALVKDMPGPTGCVCAASLSKDEQRVSKTVSFVNATRKGTGLGVLQRPLWARSNISTSHYDVAQHAISPSTAWAGAINCYFPAVTLAVSAVTSFVGQIPAWWHTPPSSPHPVPIDRPFLYSICLWHQNDRQREEGGRHRWPRLGNVTESGRWGGQSQMTQRWQWGSTQGTRTLWLFTRSWGLMAGFMSPYCLSVSPGPSPVSAQSMNNTSSLEKPNISL